MFQKLCLGFAMVAILLGCQSEFSDKNVRDKIKGGAGEPPATARPPEPPNSGQRSKEICYLGPLGDGSACLPAQSTAQIRHPDYKYRDPHNDPSFPGSFSPDDYKAPELMLPLEDISLSQFLAPHFKALEFVDDRKGPYGFFSPEILIKLEELRGATGRAVVVNSGFRSPGYNSRLSGSAKWSRHMYGDAVDFNVKGLSHKAVSEECLRLGASFFQIYEAHIHCDWRRGTEIGPKRISYSELKIRYSQALHIRSKVSKGRLHLSVEGFLAEDEEPPVFHWEILAPDGQFYEADEAEAMVENAPMGHYQVQVEVAGSSVRYEDIVVNQ